MGVVEEHAPRPQFGLFSVPASLDSPRVFSEVFLSTFRDSKQAPACLSFDFSSRFRFIRAEFHVRWVLTRPSGEGPARIGRVKTILKLFRRLKRTFSGAQFAPIRVVAKQDSRRSGPWRSFPLAPEG